LQAQFLQHFKGENFSNLSMFVYYHEKIRISLWYFDQTCLERVIALFDLTNFIQMFLLKNPLALAYLSQKIKNVRVG
jgi:hypothetical protein